MRALFARYPALWGALGLFAVTLPFLYVGSHGDGDSLRFHGDAEFIRQGLFPYRDFYLEYPPGSIPLFVLPTLLGGSHWFFAYQLESTIGWALVIVLVSFLVERRWPLYLLALVPLALGDFAIYRMDAWPVALVLGALVALTRGRTTTAYFLLAVGTVVKEWPLALILVFLLYRWTRRALAVFVAVVVVTLAPFVALAPVGSYNAFMGQINRHLQIETIGSSILLVLGRVSHIGFDAGSWNVFGAPAEAVAKLQSALQVVLILAVAWLFWRSRRTTDELLIAVLGTVVTFAFVGKVLSPQYMLWVAPFALLYSVLVVPLFVAMVLTRFLFPGQYDDLLHMDHPAIALLAVRDALVLTVLVLVLRMAWGLRRRPHAAAVAATT